jgi:alanine racemase
MDPETRRAWIEIDLGALQRNAARVAMRASAPLLPMVKADAYGLGAEAVVRALEPLDPWGFGVATVGEGEELRSLGVTRRILVFSPLLADEFADARRARLTPTLGSLETMRLWSSSGGGSWHLAVDTGMNRAGVQWDEIDSVVDYVRYHPPEGAFTHFHSAEKNDGSLEQQQQRFREAVARLPERPRYLHAENSPGVEAQGPSPWDLVRPGVFLYGVRSRDNGAIVPEQVAHFRARILELRSVRDGESVSYGATWHAEGDRRVATIGAGYADGYRRSLSSRGTALVKGNRVPVVGMVTMDMTMLDVTDVECEVGDRVTLLGRDGEDEIDVCDLGECAALSPYELLTGLKLRAPRLYRWSEQESSAA